MYREWFSIQKCILAIQLAENLGKKTQFKQYHITLIYTLISPPQQKEKKNQPLTFPLLWLLTIFKASILKFFFFTLENLFLKLAR